jgi:Ser/Thr protein kinase RdoA (MazF antagonist)
MPGAPSDSLWISVVSGSQLSGQRGNVPELAGICQAWGAAVARLHTTPVRGCTLVAPRPWVLNPQHLAPSMRGAARGSAYAAVLSAIEESESLRAATDEVAERWSERTWIHGDLSPTNVLIERRPALGVRFVDLEDAGLGDPAWDLASAIDTIDWLAPVWQAPADPLIAYFLQGYRRAGGPGRLYPAMQAVRAIATAWQVAGAADGFGAEPGSPSVRRWLDRATAHARRAVSGLQAVA